MCGSERGSSTVNQLALIAAIATAAVTAYGGVGDGFTENLSEKAGSESTAATSRGEAASSSDGSDGADGASLVSEGGAPTDFLGYASGSDVKLASYTVGAEGAEGGGWGWKDVFKVAAYSAIAVVAVAALVLASPGILVATGLVAMAVGAGMLAAAAVMEAPLADGQGLTGWKKTFKTVGEGLFLGGSLLAGSWISFGRLSATGASMPARFNGTFVEKLAKFPDKIVRLSPARKQKLLAFIQAHPKLAKRLDQATFWGPLGAVADMWNDPVSLESSAMASDQFRPELKDADWEQDHHVGSIISETDLFEGSELKSRDVVVTNTFAADGGVIARQVDFHCASGQCRYTIREGMIPDGTNLEEVEVPKVISNTVSEQQINGIIKEAMRHDSVERLLSSISQGTVISSSDAGPRTTAFTINATAGTARYVSEEVGAGNLVKRHDTIAAFEPSLGLTAMRVTKTKAYTRRHVAGSSDLSQAEADLLLAEMAEDQTVAADMMLRSASQKATGKQQSQFRTYNGR